MGAKKITLMLSYPSDEVGNHLFDIDLLDEKGVDPYTDVLSEEKYRELFGYEVHPFTGVDYVDYYKKLEDELHAASIAAKTEPAKLTEKIEALMAEIKALNAENQKLKDKMAKESVGDVMSNTVEVGSYKVLPVNVSGIDMNALRNLGDDLKAKIGSGVVILASDMDGKVNLIVMATDDAVSAGAHAGNIVKKIAPMVGGGGGGRPNMAQAGGKDPSGIANALSAGVEEAKAQLS